MIIEIISIIASLFSACGISAIVKYILDDRKEKKKEKSDAYKLAQSEERRAEMRELLTETLIPVKEDISAIKDEISSVKKEISNLKDTDVDTRLGLQAVLRDRLIQLHRYCTEQRCKGNIKKAYATCDEKTNFENMYLKYHKLGENGVMDKIYADFMSLPNYDLTLASDSNSIVNPTVVAADMAKRKTANGGSRRGRKSSQTVTVVVSEDPQE